MTSETDYNRPSLFLKGNDWLWRLMRRFAFAFDPERMHEAAIHVLRFRSLFAFGDINKTSIARAPDFKKTFAGLTFANPVGLAAGFDVDADCLPALQLLGFGFIEVGGITEKAQPGNRKPRIFRLPRDQAIVNRLNFYNRGALRLQKRLSLLRERNRLFVPIGVNLGKSNFSSLEDVPKEYLRTFQLVCDVADYVTINVSCPNSEGLQRYQTTKSLGVLLDTVCNHNETRKKPVPLFLKLGPDLGNEEAIACAETALDYRLGGLVISNTTTKRNGLSAPFEFGAGGLSGKPLFERSTQLLRCIAKDYGGKLTLIGSGGIMGGSQALAKLNAGADLLQVYTGFIYGGPNFVIRLLRYLEAHYLK
ncbi:MAG TPA: quinone-dependent dihydroorotate dehydrogenase [Myxococcota bacterium]|nr:quinone-dependent dihydroorotate dehydrogenase [Myxococcota bacterium]